MSSLKVVKVGVIRNNSGATLLVHRPPEKPLNGHWESPDGKVEVGKTERECLKTELGGVRTRGRG